MKAPRMSIASLQITVLSMVMLSGAILSNASMTVDLTAQPGQRYLTDATGIPLPDGVGVCAGAVEGPVLPGLTLADLLPRWTVFNCTPTRSLLSQAGRFSASLSQDNPDLSLQKIFLLIQRTSDNRAPAPDGSNTLAWGLFSSSLAAWNFPDNDGLPPSNSTMVTTSQVNQTWAGTIAQDTLALVDRSPAAQAYAVWLATQFPNTPASQTYYLADPDHDGQTNLQEWFHGTSPLQPSSQSVRLSTYLEFSYPRNPAAPAGVEHLETSTDLIHWQPVAESSLSRQQTNNQVRLTIAPATQSRAFYRLAITIP